MKKPKRIPKFDKYISVGDYVTWERNGFTLKAVIDFDPCSSIDDYEFDSKSQVQRWKNNDWFFGGVVISTYLDGILIDNSVSLWGLEVNMCKNRHIADVLADLEPEALHNATKVCKKLQQTLLNVLT